MSIKEQVDKGILFQMSHLGGQMRETRKQLMEITGIEVPIIDNIVTVQTWRQSQSCELKGKNCKIIVYNN